MDTQHHRLFTYDSLPSIEPHFNLLEYDYILVLPLNEYCELHVSKSKGVQKNFTMTYEICVEHEDGDNLWQRRVVRSARFFKK